MKTKLPDLCVGTFIRVRHSTDVSHVGRVDAIHRNIKNGMPGVDYTTPTDQKRWWCYLEQITEIIK